MVSPSLLSLMHPIRTSYFRLLAGREERRSGLITIKAKVLLALLGCLGPKAASDL